VSVDLVTQPGQKYAQVGGTTRGGLVHPPHVERLVRVRHDVSKPGGTHESIRQRALDNTCLLQETKRVGIAARSAQLHPETGRHREIDDDLRRLPQVEHDRVGRVGGRLQLVGRRRKALGDSPQVSLDSHRALRQHLAIQRAHFSSARTLS
jgi:hypothetical protein